MQHSLRVLTLIGVMGLTGSAYAATTCASLTSLKLPNTTVTLAEERAAGTFTPPGALPTAIPNPALAALPAFCRVTATLTPTDDSDIKIEVWLPTAGWNGKFQAVGNGGWAGTIIYTSGFGGMERGLAEALKRGYAAASTDTGHSSTPGQTPGAFAAGHPEKLIDYAQRSEHEMTVVAKAIVTAYYERSPTFSYWNGCSTGGKQGLTEAQRYPQDFDGIIAGAPANFMPHLQLQSIWVAQAVHQDQASYIPPAKYSAIHASAVQMCDPDDGLKDGLISNPTSCKFDPSHLECKSGDEPSCLTRPQVEAARKIYSPLLNSRTRQQIFPGLERGSELGWAGLAGPQPLSIANDFFKYVIFKDPNWDFRTLNFDSDVALTDKIDNGLNTATDPNLEQFFGRGGKLLLYHGWTDQLIAPQNSANYYNDVLKTTGPRSANSIRLFMAPGMNHCGGGEGPNAFDAVSALEQWVEQGKAPDQILASHSTDGKVDRTRPLCPYPQVAAYKGTGSIDDAASFVCKAP